jgi:hypothetical protein
VADDPEFETWNMLGGGGGGDNAPSSLSGDPGGILRGGGGGYDDADATANPNSVRFMNPASMGQRAGFASGGGAHGGGGGGGGGGGMGAMSSGHERRQTLLFLLDARVRRRMARTVLEMGGNAVLGYYQNFDMEGDSGIVRKECKVWMP